MPWDLSPRRISSDVVVPFAFAASFTFKYSDAEIRTNSRVLFVSATEVCAHNFLGKYRCSLITQPIGSNFVRFGLKLTDPFADTDR